MIDFFKKYFDTQSRSRIYLDYAAATPVRKEVQEAMHPYLSQFWGNASSIHIEGVKARAAVDASRTTIARLLKIRPREVVFTGSGTESNNLALIGYIEQLHAEGRAYGDMEVVSTRIEHPSIFDTLKHLEERGVTVRYVPLDVEGRIMFDEFEKLFTMRTVLVTVAYVNSEIGVVQDIKRITRMVRAWNAEHNVTVRVHTDASQAPLWLPCGFDTLGVDLMTLDAGKCYGPKGVGVLGLRHGVSIKPILFGGGQENGLRSGTENTALIVGCARALAYAQETWQSRSEEIASLRERMFTAIETHIPEACINGSRTYRVANNVHISLPNFDMEYGVIWLDSHGVSASTRSACGSVTEQGSYVVREITNDEARAQATIRFTLGEETKNEEILIAVGKLQEYVSIMQAYKKVAMQKEI